MTGMDENRLDGSSSEVEASDEAADCALNTKSSQFAM
jgi:hypothetical protein